MGVKKSVRLLRRTKLSGRTRGQREGGRHGRSLARAVRAGTQSAMYPQYNGPFYKSDIQLE